MGVQLYATDLLENAKPVKKGRKKAIEAPASPPPTESVSESVTPSETEKEVKKEKKPLTEKQLAALEKAKEARRLKKEQAEKEKQEALEQERLEKEEEERKAAEKLAKKEAAKEKRRLARLAKREASETLEEQEPRPKKVKKARDQSEPPEWFKKYIHGVKLEQSKTGSEKKSQRMIKEEVSEEAKQKWEDGQTRDRVTHEVDNHMNRMYSMIFGQRRMVQ